MKWTVTVDTVTDALLRSHLAENSDTSRDALVEEAVNRELDRRALLAGDRRMRSPRRSEDVWSITVPRPR